MKLAIHQEPGTFSDRWIPYCQENDISYVIVDCYASDIVEQLREVDCLLWHWHLADSGSHLFARQLTASVEAMGIHVFPNSTTSWHYDDKIAQKYLFEALGLPLVPSYVFYDKAEALLWVEKAIFPKVFKLRGGAGSVNVSLVHDVKQGRRLVHRAFKRGFPVLNRKAIIGDRIRLIKKRKDVGSVLRLLGSLLRCVFPSRKERLSPRQIGYVYFQDFIPNNDWDTRLVVVGKRCVGVRRYCRDGDFRASGSGKPAYDKSFFPLEMVDLAFKSAASLGMQSAAFDFIVHDGKFYIVEVSYCYIMGPFYDDCPGYWDAGLNWIEAPVDLQRFILEDALVDLGRAE